MRFWQFNSILLSILLLVACENNSKPTKKINQKKLKEVLIKKNKTFTKIENEQIDGYIKRHQMQVVKTPTGLRYQVYQKGFGIKPTCGDLVEVTYTLSLLNGKKLYETENGKPTFFMVCKDDVESGLHEGIQYLKVGDKAKIIIPSYLAHGIAGDFDKIPPRSTIVYDIHLRGIKNKQ